MACLSIRGLRSQHGGETIQVGGAGVILLNVKVKHAVIKSVYNAGCAGVALSQYFVKKVRSTPTCVVPLTLSSADGVITINQR